MINGGRKEYVAGGWQFIECTKCGARFNAGRPGNCAGGSYCSALKEEWWAKHVGISQDRYALKLSKEDTPELCPSIAAKGVE